jgi:hypothetical protein
MPDIMIRCPEHGVTISTRISTDVVQFETLPDVAVPCHCPACHRTHYWRPKEAWVQGANKLMANGKGTYTPKTRQPIP